MQAGSGSSRLERTLMRPGVACGGLALATLLLTWPLAARLGSAVPAGAADLWQNVWNFWWWRECLAGGRSPYWTPLLFHPSGSELVLHTHSPFNLLVGLPVTIALGPGAAYGFCILLATWLSAFGAYLLARELTGSGRAALLAGLVFAFFPQRLEQTLEHLNLASTQFLPLSVWAFVRLARRGGRGPVAAVGACFALQALCDWQLALELALLLAVLGAAALVRPARPRGALARDLALAGVLATAATLPAAWPLLGDVAAGARYRKPPEPRGIDAAFLLRPHFHHPLLGRFVREAWAERRAYPSAGFTCYLGVVPLALAGAAVARRARGAGSWAAVLAGSTVLALGAHPYWNGRLVEDVTLPFAWLEPVPILGALRIANRFLVPASLALAVLVAFGWTALRRRSDPRFALLLGLLVLDYLWLPYPLRDDALSPLYARLRASGPPGAVLDVPFVAGPASAEAMRAQTVHARPIAGGYVSVVGDAPLRAIAREPALLDVYGFAPRLSRPLERERLVALGFGVVLLHKDQRRGWADARRQALDPADLFAAKILGRLGGMPDERFALARRRLEEACGAPFYEDALVAAFDLTGTAGGRPRGPAFPAPAAGARGGRSGPASHEPPGPDATERAGRPPPIDGSSELEVRAGVTQPQGEAIAAPPASSRRDASARLGRGGGSARRAARSGPRRPPADRVGDDRRPLPGRHRLVRGGRLRVASQG